MNKFKAIIASIHQETPQVKRFVLKPQEPGFNYLPGQWIDLFCEVDGKQEVGGYSLTSQPTSENHSIELAIKHSDKHPVTKYIHESAKEGDVITLRPARPDWLSFGEQEKADSDFMANREDVITDEGRFDFE